MKDNYLAILQILEKNSEVTKEDIAKMLGIDAKEVLSIIDELEKTKIILGYRAVINKEKAFAESVYAIIEVGITPEPEGGFDRIASLISEIPEVRSVYLVSGTFDLFVLVEGKTLREIANFVSLKLSAIERVHHTGTHFIMRTYKEDGISIASGSESNERVIIS